MVGRRPAPDDGAGPSQASKRSRGDDYPRGTIKTVRVKNFMTYGAEWTSISVGPRLNLILGPNGTGKSSLVCAICVGLGGSLQLLGRASELSSYVRRGQRECATEITVSDGPGRADLVFMRHITVKDTGTGSTASKWHLNGRDVGKEKFQEKTKELNVQLSNLCQFLPQDKVTAFAQMKPTELLRETERAIGDARLLDLHEDLIAKTAEIKTLAARATLEGETLAQKQAEREGMERDVARANERAQLLDEADFIRKKIPWLQLEAAEAELQKATEFEAAASQRVKALQRESRQSDAPLKEAEARGHAALDEQRVTKAKLRKVSESITPAQAALSKATEEAEAIKDKMQGLEEKARQRDTRIQKLEHESALLEASASKLPPIPEVDGERESEMKEAIKALRNEAQAKGWEVEERGRRIAELERAMQGAHEAIAKIDDVKNRKLHALEQMPQNRGISKTYHFVQQNQAKFTGHVYGPVALEIAITKRDAAAQLEAAIAAPNWAYFVVTNREDQRVLQQECRNRGLYIPTITMVAGSGGEVPHPAGPASDYTQYGITGTLDQVFESPPIIKQFLCDECGINSAYIGTREVANNVDMLFERTNIRRVFSPDQSFSKSGSRYNRATTYVSTSHFHQQARFVGVGDADAQHERARRTEELRTGTANVERIKAEMEQLQRGAEDLHAQRTGLEKELKGFADARQAAIAKHKRFTQLKSVKAKALAKAQAEPDPMAAKPALEAQMKRALKKLVPLSTKMSDAVCATAAALVPYCVPELTFEEAKQQAKAHKSANEHMRAALDGAKRRLQQMKDVVKGERQAVRAAKAKAKDEGADMEDPDIAARMDALLPPRFVNIHGELVEGGEDGADLQQAPWTAVAVEASANDREEQAGLLTVNDPRVVERYKAVSAEIEKLEATAAAAAGRRDALQTQIDATKNEWLPELEGMVEKINSTFERNFAEIGSAGCLRLRTDPVDYGEYAIEILVKFREEEELTMLSASRQSGGERSVSTILYLIAIQAVTHCPFRVVDEINQGMDPINERKVFNQLVASANQDDTPQCFLLTPKLLPDLIYYPNVRVLNLFNGTSVSGVATTFDKTRLFGARGLETLSQRGIEA